MTKKMTKRMMITKNKKSVYVLIMFSEEGFNAKLEYKHEKTKIINFKDILKFVNAM